jgi:hypothetical protein
MTVTAKNQQPMRTNRKAIYMLSKDVFQLVETYFIVCPAILASQKLPILLVGCASCTSQLDALRLQI